MMDAQKIISQGEKYGADEVEVFISSAMSTSIAQSVNQTG